MSYASAAHFMHVGEYSNSLLTPCNRRIFRHRCRPGTFIQEKTWIYQSGAGRTNVYRNAIIDDPPAQAVVCVHSPIHPRRTTAMTPPATEHTQPPTYQDIATVLHAKEVLGLCFYLFEPMDLLTGGQALTFYTTCNRSGYGCVSHVSDTIYVCICVHVCMYLWIYVRMYACMQDAIIKNVMQSRSKQQRTRIAKSKRLIPTTSW